ncbi:hypothetical protein F3G60_34405, partial [Pseudomonas aeruginosa]
SGVSLADPTYHIPSSIDILVGADVFWNVIGTNRIQLGKNKPVLFETKLGWVISGSLLNKTNSKDLHCLLSCDSSKIGTDLTKFWELDSIPSSTINDLNSHPCEKVFTETTTRAEDGRFNVTLPFHESPKCLGDSYYMAKHRFLSL